MHSSTRRLAIALTLFVMISIAMMECSGNPENHEGGGNVADAIRYLQDLERIARPR